MQQQERRTGTANHACEPNSASFDVECLEAFEECRSVSGGSRFGSIRRWMKSSMAEVIGHVALIP